MYPPGKKIIFARVKLYDSANKDTAAVWEAHFEHFGHAWLCEQPVWFVVNRKPMAHMVVSRADSPPRFPFSEMQCLRCPMGLLNAWKFVHKALNAAKPMNNYLIVE